MKINKRYLFIAVGLTILATVVIVVPRLLDTAKPFIESISPSSGTIGTKITITGREFNLNNDIAFANIKGNKTDQDYKTIYINNLTSLDGRTLNFELPQYGGLCPSVIKPIEACPEIAVTLNEGEYELFVVNKNGESNKKRFAITSGAEKEAFFETIAKDEPLIGSNKKANYIVKDKKGWKKLWEDLYPDKTQRPALPDIDFTKDIILATLSGEKSTGGYITEFSKIVELEDRIEASIVETIPGQGCNVTQAFTSPYHIIKMSKTDKEIEFLTEQEITICSSQ